MNICEKCGEALVECGCDDWVDTSDGLPAPGASCQVRLNAICSAYHIPDDGISRWITDAHPTLEATVAYWRYIKEKEIEDEMDL